MTENETIGIHRIQDLDTGNETETGNYTGTDIAEFESYFSEAFGSHLAGTTSLTGLIVIFLFGMALFKADVGLDTKVVVLLPTTLFLGQQGFLPGGEAVIYAVLIFVALILSIGVFRFFR